MESFFQINAVEKKLGVAFQDKTLLMTAFVHRSFWNENQEVVAEHNECLEFLGDSVLGLLVASYLYQSYPELDEGALSKLRSQLVDAPACAGFAGALGVGEFVLLGKGEQLNRGKGRESILADLFEAVIGALYLDQGLEAVRTFFLGHFQGVVDAQVKSPQRNWKADLQDVAQREYQHTPRYEVEGESGPAHAREFVVSVWIGERRCGEGRGLSKKEAQVAAAEDAMKRIEE